MNSSATDKTSERYSPTDTFKSGFLALVGRPNAGKSTLINSVIGEKIAITSTVSQTTRHRLCGVYTRPDFQIVLVDTPGLHKPHDVLGEQLNASALKGICDVDCIAFVIDAGAAVGTGDAWIADSLSALSVPKIAVINKIDTVDQNKLLKQRFAVQALYPWDQTVEISALQMLNIDSFLHAVVRFLPPGPLWYPPGVSTDQSQDVRIAEMIREKILHAFTDEVPHCIGVTIDSREHNAKKHIEVITATIYVERDSQKGIIIGCQGSSLKKIGTSARLDIESFLNCRVFLDLRVKVKKNWRRDAAQIRRFGYGEGG